MSILKYLSIFNRALKCKKETYSFNGVDLIIDYLFKNKKKGFFIDVGANHPIANNNTYLLYKRGWRGINIDLDKKNIELFDLVRSKDTNLNFAISDNNKAVDLYFYHDKSPINTLNKDVSDFQKAKVNEVKKIKTTTLNDIISKINKVETIDYLNIDVEGHEEKVLNGFDINSYKPSVISVEFLDLNMKSLEFKNNEINNIIKSDIYKFFIDHNYHFVNWLHGDLIFVHDNFRNI